MYKKHIYQEFQNYLFLFITIDIIFKIYQSIASDEEINDLRSKYLLGTIDYKSAKELLFEVILTKFSEARERFEQIDKGEIDNILTKGEECAQKVADETFYKIKKAISKIIYFQINMPF